jgi:anti-anti-sigma regulatory factor
MASNFGISVYRFNDNLLLKLSGDFDSSSAFQLLCLMRNCVNEPEKIIINTDSVCNMEPVGLSIFRYNLGSLVRHPAKFVFTGDKASFLIETWPEKGRPGTDVKHESFFDYRNMDKGEHLFY